MTTIARTIRPRGVTYAATVQLLIAVLFVSVPLIGVIWSADVQAAAEAEAARQGSSAGVLAEHGISFAERGLAIAIPVAVAGIVVVLALLNLAGKRTGESCRGSSCHFSS
jgi:hypothetical protein